LLAPDGGCSSGSRSDNTFDLAVGTDVSVGLVTELSSGALVSIWIGSVWASATCSTSVGVVASPLATPAQALMSNTEAMSHFLFGLMICANFTIASR